MEYIKLEKIGDRVFGEASINGEVQTASFDDMILATVWAEEIAEAGREAQEAENGS